MSDTTARLHLPVIAPAQAQKHVTHNEALRLLDGITQLVLAGVGLNTPVAVSGDGEVFALGAAPTDAWSGQAGMLAQWDGTGWQFIAPQEGWRAWDMESDRHLVYLNDAWTIVPLNLQNIDRLGINATADTTNRLTLAADASLLNHDGAGHQLKINKAGAGDTASVMFQDGFGGRAEMGLSGDDDFHIKVSADGSTWTEALVVDATTGQVQGSAVQAGVDDLTVGRIVTTQGARAAALGGHGAVYGPAAGVNIDAVAAGFSGLVSDANAGIWPAAPSGKFVFVQTTRIAGGQAARQTADYGHATTGVPGALVRFERLRSETDGLWSPWSRTYTGASAIGTVGQTGGVPTGALFETGSNANGRYARFADGTQVCWRSLSVTDQTINAAYGSVFIGSRVWTFPATFSVPPAVSAPMCRWGTGATWGSGHGVSTTQVTFRFFDAFSRDSGTTFTAEYLVIGRWY